MTLSYSDDKNNIEQTKKKIVIVGAGPTGLLLAHYLIRRPNYDITIVEGRDDPRSQPPHKMRSFPMALQFQAKNALQQIGLFENKDGNSVESKGVYLEKICLNLSNGRQMIIEKSPPLFSIDRNKLTLTLLEVLEQENNSMKHPTSSLQPIQFLTSLKEVDLDLNQVTVLKKSSQKDGQESESAISFDHLVAADGARSQIRKTLAMQNKLENTEKDILDDYRSISLAVSDSDPSVLGRDKLCVWSFGNGNKLIAVPLHEDSAIGAYVFNKGTDPFAKLQTADEVLDFFGNLKPSIRHLITQEEAVTMLGRPTSTLVTVRCDQLHVEDKVLLLGDAAHAVSASIGHGCNSALQDVQIFCNMLEEHNDDWAEVLPLYTKKRLPDAHAIADLSEYSVARTKLMKFESLFRLAMKKLLPVWLHRLLMRPSTKDLIDEEALNLSYSQVLEQSKWWIDRVKASIHEA